MVRVYTDTVSIQGKGAWGVLQIGSIAICLGRAKDGPRWQLVLFRPYSQKWFHFRVFGKRANKSLKSDFCPRCVGFGYIYKVGTGAVVDCPVCNGTGKAA